MRSGVECKEIARPQATDVVDFPSQARARDLSLARAPAATGGIAWVVAAAVGKPVELAAGDALVVRAAAVAVSIARSGDQSGRRLAAEDAVWAWMVGIVDRSVGEDGSCRRGHFCQDIGGG